MFSDTAILAINFSCMGIMVLMMAIMAGATRMKGGAGWAAVILATTTIPAYLSNLTRDFSMDAYLVWYIIGATLNLVCFPATWFFTRRQLDKSFRLTKWSLLHAVPAVISLLTGILYYIPMSPAEIKADMAFMESGGESLPAVATGLSPNNISRSINGYLGKSFFDLVNEMRVGEAKSLLQELNSGYTIDSIFPECGFSSRTSFFRAFKKFEGVAPAQWLNKTSSNNS